MDRNVHLRLYGTIEHGAEDSLAWDLYQSEAVSRLRDISLSSTPPRFAPHGMAASRFEHSVGVGYLARKLCDWRSPLAEHRDLLTAAALCHDIGSPPFSHISELFFWELTGRTHEQQTQDLLAPGTELQTLLSSYGVDAKRVVEIITGREPFLGPLISGTIDLDNVDNSIHLLVSLGYHEDSPYHPLRLLRAFKVRAEQIQLDSGYLSEILGWQEGRRLLYDLLHSEPNLSSASMLYRALEYAFAANKLSEDFFALDESDALHVLRRRCGKPAGKLVESALRWQQYPLLHQTLAREEDPRLVAIYDDWKARKRFTDAIADEIGVPRDEVALYVGRDRGEKAITLPFIGEHAGPVRELFAQRSGLQRVALFAHKDHVRLRGTQKVVRAIARTINALPEPSGDASRHVFF